MTIRKYIHNLGEPILWLSGGGGRGLNDGDNGSPEIIKGTTLWSNIEKFGELKNNHQGVTLG